MISLDRDALGEAARLVDLTATDAGDVIGKKLQSDDSRDGCDQGMTTRDGDEVIHELDGLGVAFGDDAEDFHTASSALLDVAERLTLAGDVHRQGDDRCVLVEATEISGPA